MNTDQLRQRFPTEQACREFFEDVIWPEGRICPHCNSKKSISITGKTARAGLYQCSTCQRQFTDTYAQHKIIFMEMAPGHVLHGQFQ